MTTPLTISAVFPLHISESDKSNSIELADILLASIIKFSPKNLFHTFFIVCPENQVSSLLLHAANWPSLPIEVIGEESLVPELKNYPTVGGWRKQQVIKLAIAKLVRSPFFLTFDADVICTSSISLEILMPQGRALLQQHERLTRSWWWSSSAKYLKTTPNINALGMSVTPAILSSQVCLDLIETLNCNKSGWVDSLLGPHKKYAWQRMLPWHKGRYSWTEYSLYYLFLEKKNSISTYHRICDSDSPQKLLSNENSVWYSTPFKTWDPSIVFSEDDTGLFCVVQSNKNIPPKDVWKRVEKYIT